MKMLRSVAFFLLFFPSIMLASYVPKVERSVPIDPKVNVHVYIPSLLVGIISMDATYNITDKFAVGPKAAYYSYGDYSGYMVGLTSDFALSGRVFDDRVWLVKPYVVCAHTNRNYDNSKKKSGGIIAGADLAYQWMWNSGVNLRAGIGLYYSSKKPVLRLGDSHFGGTLMFSIGYAF